MCVPQAVFLKTAESVALPLFQCLPDGTQRISTTPTPFTSQPEVSEPDEEPAAPPPVKIAGQKAVKAGAPATKSAAKPVAGGVKKAVSAGKAGGLKARRA